MSKFLHSDIYQEIRACLTLAAPLSLANLIQSGIIMTDTWTMGIFGSQTLAGGGLGSSTVIFFEFVGIYSISAVGVVAAIAWGAKDQQKLQSTVAQGFWLAIALALAIMLVLWNLPTYMHYLGQQEALIQLARDYMRAALWGLPACLAYEVLKNVLISINKPKLITAIAVWSLVFNLIANYIFAFGKFGIPALGLAGIGWATTLVWVVEFLLALIFVAFSKGLQEYQLLKQVLQFDSAILLEIIQIGWPIGANYLTAVGAGMVVIYLFGYFGTVTLAAYRVAGQMVTVMTNIGNGIGQATVSRVGQMYGAEDTKAVRRSGFTGIAIGAGTGIIGCLLVALEKKQIVSFFLHPQTEVDFQTFDLAIIYLTIVTFLQVFNEIDTVSIAALQGLKDTKIPFLWNMLSQNIVGLGTACFLAFYCDLKGTGLLIGRSAGLILTGCLFSIRFYLKTQELTFAPSQTKQETE
ncbi:MAG: MATE family efflux transporter [Symploca sp. SIO1B1]|nr:MATE family efflux transporter [Symploca sp. SIO1B1]